MSLKAKLSEVAARIADTASASSDAEAAQREKIGCPLPDRWWAVAHCKAAWREGEAEHIASCKTCQRTEARFKENGLDVSPARAPATLEVDSVGQAVHRLEEGELDAQFPLVSMLQPFLDLLLSLVRRRRGAALQARIDSQAVVNDALNSFLTGVPKHEFPLLENREQVKKVLTTLVLTTLSDEVRKHRRQKRTPVREQASAGGRPEDLPDPKTIGPVADTLRADLAPWLEEVVEELRSEHERAIDIIELSYQGLSNNDIARKVGLGVRRVQLLKRQMYDRLRQKAAAS